MIMMKMKEEEEKMVVMMKERMMCNTLSVAYINRFPRRRLQGIYRRCRPTHRPTSRRAVCGAAG